MHFLGRALREQGHEVRLIPAQFVRPFVKSNKNDYRDAEAIAEAVENLPFDLGIVRWRIAQSLSQFCISPWPSKNVKRGTVHTTFPQVFTPRRE
jgi:hypothetical protein